MILNKPQWKPEIEPRTIVRAVRCPRLTRIDEGGIARRKQCNGAALTVLSCTFELRDHDAVAIFGIGEDRGKLHERDRGRRETSQRRASQRTAFNGTKERKMFGDMKPAIAANRFGMAQPRLQPIRGWN